METLKIHAVPESLKTPKVVSVKLFVPKLTGLQFNRCWKGSQRGEFHEFRF